jgi:hypothetical protein
MSTGDVSQEKEAAARRALFEDMSLLMGANGIEVNDRVRALMRPLLEGEMSYEKHEALLESMLKEAKG